MVGKWTRNVPYGEDTDVGVEIRCLEGDERHLAVGLNSGEIEIWGHGRGGDQNGNRLEDGAIVKVHDLPKGHVGSVLCLALNDKLLISGAFDRTLCVWHRHRDYELVQRVQDQHMVYGISLNPKNTIIS